MTAATFPSQCRRKVYLVGQRQPYLPADRQTWLDGELAKLDGVPLLSQEELERQRQEELVSNWTKRLDSAAKRIKDARPHLSISEARTQAMDTDKDLQLPAIKARWEQTQAGEWEQRLAKVTTRDGSSVTAAVDGDPELKRGLELAEVRRRWKIAKQAKPTRRRARR